MGLKNEQGEYFLVNIGKEGNNFGKYENFNVVSYKNEDIRHTPEIDEYSQFKYVKVDKRNFILFLCETKF